MSYFNTTPVDTKARKRHLCTYGYCAQGDHCINPDHLQDFCWLSGVHLSSRVLYMVQGMWRENHL